MSKLMPTVIRCRSNDFVLEVCHGEIPDICRLLWFDSPIELGLPDTEMLDEEFGKWVCRYRNASLWVTDHMLRMAQCN
ncbi:hypothetical protein LCGC14_0142420 [marine sediment metagenome]|uniref:Uncharacterized protein n=1 Tax=marine sediment metagenome TaxID=412755 RepID=A0A0F9VGN1_9ZZZZ